MDLAAMAAGTSEEAVGPLPALVGVPESLQAATAKPKSKVTSDVIGVFIGKSCYSFIAKYFNKLLRFIAGVKEPVHGTNKAEPN